MMKIKCPKCVTSYVIKGITKAMIARSLRCSTCGHNWQQNLTPSGQSLTSKTSQHVINPFHFQFPHYVHQSFYKAHPYVGQGNRYNSNPGAKNEELSTSSLSLTQSETSSKPKSETTLSQCVFCQRSARCNLHDLYSGRRH